MTADVRIGEKWLEADFDFLFNEKSITPPEPKLVLIEIPGTSEVVDMTESNTGEVEYQQRKITIKLEHSGGKDSFYSKYSELANYLHGKRLPIIFSKDPGYYWIGRIAITGAEPKFYGQTITLTATVDPYKYETQSSIEPWLWETFNFKDGIIRKYYDVIVPGSITIIGRRKRICPKFICTAAAAVSYLGNTYSLAAGTNQIPEIYLGAGEHILTFSGSGIVEVDYRGGSL